MSGVKGNDVEEGSTTTSLLLYPGIRNDENDLRWDFIRKVYYILASQILLTTIVSAGTVLYLPVNNILHGKTILLILLILPLLLLLPLYFYRQKHPLNFVFLGIYTITLSISIGIACATINGKIVLEALILTSAVVLSLTGYTFWASKRGQDFSFLGPILFASLNVLILTGFLQVGLLVPNSFSVSIYELFFPLGSTVNAIYCAVSAIVFCAYIVFDTYKLIKRFSYDEYIWASVHLYLDILNLFLDILRLLRPRNTTN
ncbi:BI1-like protein isoform X1 [Solanum lycopersicum]|uniref:BI1-like protein isoform X1 n=1 Tax=Solanum lycopersicum TaxID=4081 RepID=UPI0008FED20B|nr:BI1-like protein isoform X1 [Solanum lycopersicum]